MKELIVTTAFTVLSTILVWLVATKYRKLSKTKRARTGKKRIVKVCPYSKESNFIVQVSDKIPPSPLELFEDWTDDAAVSKEEKSEVRDKESKPLAARWLNAGLSGQDKPGILQPGLKPLRDSKYFLVEDRHRLKHELSLKKKNLDDPDRHPNIFVAEPDSLDAQRECLELFLDYLPRRYPDVYEVDEQANSVTVVPIGTTFSVKDWWDTAPLELCERIVQEDLILMRPDDRAGGDDDDDDRRVRPYRMAAASVVFSFGRLPEKLGRPADWIHAPVPGYEKHLRRALEVTFSTLKSERPLWRNNWEIAPTGALDEPLSHADRRVEMDAEERVKRQFLKVEYQTLRRLPRSGNLLFTVKTMSDPLSSLESLPRAAACLAASIRGMSADMRRYKGIANEESSAVLLSYLDSVAKKTTGTTVQRTSISK